MTGRIVTHFSLGSFLESQGFAMSSLLTRREWKYRGATTGMRPVALAPLPGYELAKLDGGRETAGDWKGS